MGAVEVRKVVRGWLKLEPNPLGVCLGHHVTKVETFSDKKGRPVYYVVCLQPKGFVVVPADDLVEPIIGFAADGTYNASAKSPLAALVSRDVPRRVTAARTLEAAASTATEKKELALQQRFFQDTCLKAQTKWNTLQAFDDGVAALGVPGVSDLRVGPLVVSTWGQTTVGSYIDGISCYNFYTPPYGPGNCNNYPCGCVATAMAQLMRYHEYPTSGYVWSNMPLEPDTGITLIERWAIGDLCYDAAESIGTSYGSGGSSASLNDADEELQYTFGYSNSIHGYNNRAEIGAGLTGMINPNLDAGKPVLLGVTGSDGPHAIVCDGYGHNGSTLYHHLNMGWDGRDNVWYALPIIQAAETGYESDTVHTCVYNVFTSESGEIISGRVTDLADNPIEDVTIIAETESESTYQTTTNANGIYALLGVPSNEDYTVSASKSGHAFIEQNVSTGLSEDDSIIPGNVWGVDFVSQNATPPDAHDQTVSALSGSIELISLYATDEGQPDPPAELTYTIASLPTHGSLTDPGAGPISSVPYTLSDNGNTVDYRPCTYFVGQDSFTFKANDGGTPPEGGDSNLGTITINVDNTIYTTFEPSTNTYSYWPMYTSYHDSRTQVIYLAGEIGAAKTITDLALEVYTAPGQTLNNWTIRMKHTTQAEYAGYPEFETSGWTVVFQGNEPPTPIGWRNFSFQIPFEYNGTDNLMIDFSHNNSWGSTNGACMVSDMGTMRIVQSRVNSTHGDPLDWTSYMGLALYITTAVPNIKLISTVPAQPIVGDFEPDCDVDLADFGILALSWLAQEGQGHYNPICDISIPADNSVDILDLEVFADNWLTGR